MESYLFQGLEATENSLVVEGTHKPGSLTVASGAWISNAGSALLGKAVTSSSPMNSTSGSAWRAARPRFTGMSLN